MKTSPQFLMLALIGMILSFAVGIFYGFPHTFLEFFTYAVHILGLGMMVIAVFVLSLKVCWLPVPPILPRRNQKKENQENLYE